MSVCVCACCHVRACVRACVRVCARADGVTAEPGPVPQRVTSAYKDVQLKCSYTEVFDMYPVNGPMRPRSATGTMLNLEASTDDCDCEWQTLEVLQNDGWCKRGWL